MFQARDVKSLRDKTGCGMMECKNALTEAKGDEQVAFRILREKGLAQMSKKGGRQTTEGTVALYFDSTYHRAAMIEINSETDFTAKNEVFLNFAHMVAKTAVLGKINHLDELREAKLHGGSGQKVTEALADLVSKIGENITLRRLKTLETKPDGLVVGYSHMGGKIATLVEFGHVDPEVRESLAEFGREIGMHVVAMAPLYLDQSSVPSAVVTSEQEIIHTKLIAENKPQDKIPMIAKGKLAKFFSEVCVLKQKYVKDPQHTVAQVISDFDPKVNLTGFYRFELGDGLEKKADNFADEVARQVSLNS
ncbi:MAG: translation elongation factor Ts [Proteobacteria bacterium]|nr:translation elongation factor Ts [Pseudomonadota bacterium]